MLHGPQRGIFDLTFRVPSECADAVASGQADIGIVPSIELARQELSIVPGLGIACRGAVRSILLVSKRPLDQVATLAADSSSRTSVELARIILQERHGVAPRFVPHAPHLTEMLEIADAALVIGDPALQYDPATSPHLVLDLGQEWYELTGMPMVFAVWAGRPGAITPDVIRTFEASWHFGRQHLEDIIRLEAGPRGVSAELAREYLTRHIVHALGPAEYDGLRRFLACAGGQSRAPAK